MAGRNKVSRAAVVTALSCALVASGMQATSANASPNMSEAASVVPRDSALGAATLSLATELLRSPTQQLAPEAFPSEEGAGAAPNEAAAAAEAQKQDAPVENLSARTESTQTFINPDGTKTLEEAASPVRIRQADGSWADIDPTLVQRADGAYAPRAFPEQVVVGGGGSTTAARVGVDDGSVLTISWPEVLPAPAVDGGVATYRLNEDMDLLVIMVGGGVSVRVRFNRVPTAAERALVLGLKSDGTKVVESSTGGLNVTNADGDLVSQSGSLTAWDSRKDEAGDPLKLVPISAALATTSGTGFQKVQTLSLSTPTGFLDDPSTVYPVTIDPDVTTNLADTKDTYVRWSEAYSHGGLYGMDVGRTSTDANPARSYVQFNTSAVSGHQVLSASLKLLQYHANTCSARTMIVAPADAAWSESMTAAVGGGEPGSLTSDNTTITEMHGFAGSSCADNAVDTADITNMVQAWASGKYANNGIQLQAQVASDLSYERRFCTSEYVTSMTYCKSASDVPVISVTYRNPDSAVGAGDRKYYQYVAKHLTDRMQAKINVGTGNLLVSAEDAKIAGIVGLDLGITRYYNSNAATAPGMDFSHMGPGWSTSLGGSVRLEFPNLDSNTVDFYGPSGYRVRFTKSGSNYNRQSPGGEEKLVTDGAGYLKIKLHSKTNYRFRDFSLDYRLRGQLLSMSDKNSNSLTYAYNTDGTLKTVTDTQGRAAKLTYSSSAGVLTDIEIDDNDASKTWMLKYHYTYDGNRLATSQLSDVNTTYLTDTSDSVNKGAVTTYTYDSNGLLSQIDDARESALGGGGGTTKFAYTSGDLTTLTRVTDSSSTPDSITGLTYYSTVSGTDCANNSKATARTVVDGERTDVTDTTTFCTDNKARVVRVKDPKGHIRSRDYDDVSSNVVTADDSGLGSGGGATQMTYSSDGNDNMTSASSPASTDTTNGNSSSPSSGTETFGYSDTNNPNFPTSMRDFNVNGAGASSDNDTWDYNYDDNGNLTSATANMQGTAAKKISYHYCWNSNGQMTRIDPIDSAGNNGTAGGNCGTATQGNDTLLTYDSSHNLTSIDRPGSDGDVSYTYDQLSRVNTVTDGRGVTTTYQYDGYDHVTGESFSKSGSSTQSASWTYDQDGNLTDLTDPAGTTHFGYDELNRRTSEQRGTGPTKLYGYDPAGNLTSYDADGAGGDNPTTYSFDENNLNTSVSDPHLSAAIALAYDRHDRLKKTTFPMAGASGNDLVQRAHYDDGGLVNCVYSYREANPPSLVADHDVDDYKCPESTDTGLITFRHYNYDNTFTVGGITFTAHTDHVYTMRDKGDVETHYDYDPINRLTQATVGMNGTQLREFDYNYNRHSNLISDHITGSNPDLRTGWDYFGYDAGDQLCATASTSFDSDDCSTAPYSATTYSYDNAGELTGSSAGLSLDYNLLGQTDQATAPGSSPTVSMAYAGVTQDRRTSASSSSSSTTMTYGFKGIDTQTVDGHEYGFVRDASGHFLALVDESTTSAAVPKYYLTDAQQTVLATMDTGGNTRRYLYEPYGKQIRTWVDTTPSGNTSTGSTPPDGSETITGTSDAINPWRYGSGYLDQTTGFLKFGTRYYMPSLARWTQIDPKAGEPTQPLSMNPYIYASADPANRQDQAGTSDFLDFVGSVSPLYTIYTLSSDLAHQDYEEAFYDSVQSVVAQGYGGACMAASMPIGDVDAGLCLAAGAIAGWGVRTVAERNDVYNRL